MVFPHSYCTSWCEYATRAPTVDPDACTPAPRPPRQFGGMQGATPWPSMASRKLGCLRLARVLRYAPHPAAERPISVLHPLTSPHLVPLVPVPPVTLVRVPLVPLVPVHLVPSVLVSPFGGCPVMREHRMHHQRQVVFTLRAGLGGPSAGVGGSRSPATAERMGATPLSVWPRSGPADVHRQN